MVCRGCAVEKGPLKSGSRRCQACSQAPSQGRNLKGEFFEPRELSGLFEVLSLPGPLALWVKALAEAKPTKEKLWENYLAGGRIAASVNPAWGTTDHCLVCRRVMDKETAFKAHVSPALRSKDKVPRHGFTEVAWNLQLSCGCNFKSHTNMIDYMLQLPFELAQKTSFVRENVFRQFVVNVEPGDRYLFFGKRSRQQLAQFVFWILCPTDYEQAEGMLDLTDPEWSCLMEGV